MTNKLRLFEFRINGEKEWVAHFNMLNAIQWYLNQTNMSLSEIEPDDDVIEIPESEWASFTVTYPDDEQEPETFDKAVIKCNNKPDWIATTLD